MPHDTHSRRQFCRRAGVALTALGGSGLAATTASAQTDSSASRGIFGEDVGDGGDLWAFLRGRMEGYGTVSPPEDAATLADRMRNEFNANSADWIDYGNWVIEEAGVEPIGDTVVQVDVALTRLRWPTVDETVATAIDVNYDDTLGEFTGLEWRLGAPEDPDYQATVKNDAAENGAAELAEFRRKFIATEDGERHELPSSEYVSAHAGRYASLIEIGDEGRSVLELFLGELR